MVVLDAAAVAQKLKRMAYEIWENNAHEDALVLYGIAPGGVALMEQLATVLTDISTLSVELRTLTMDKTDVDKPVSGDFDGIFGKNILIIDDVANSGRTLLYAMKPLLAQQPRKIEVAVLANRMHKRFPIKPNIIGHEFSTTLQENISVIFNDDGNISVLLD